MDVKLLNREAVIDLIVNELLGYFGPDIVPAKVANIIQQMSTRDINVHYFSHILDVVYWIISRFRFKGAHKGGVEEPAMEIDKIIRNRILNRLRALGYNSP